MSHLFFLTLPWAILAWFLFELFKPSKCGSRPHRTKKGTWKRDKR